jgi:hypothetical protein
MKKVLRVKNSEFLLNVYPDRIETTAHIKHAMDVTSLDFELLDNILHNLYNAGYREMKIIEVKE